MLCQDGYLQTQRRHHPLLFHGVSGAARPVYHLADQPERHPRVAQPLERGFRQVVGKRHIRGKMLAGRNRGAEPGMDAGSGPV